MIFVVLYHRSLHFSSLLIILFELVASGERPRSNVHRLMIPPTILGCRIFQAHDVSKLCGLVFFSVLTGHCWRLSLLQAAGVDEACRRMWVVHLVEYRFDCVTVTDENHGKPICDKLKIDSLS